MGFKTCSKVKRLKVRKGVVIMSGKIDYLEASIISLAIIIGYILIYSYKAIKTVYKAIERYLMWANC